MTTLSAQYIGSISEGTMRAQDLVPRFIAVLAAADPQHELVLDWAHVWDSVLNLADFLDVEPQYVAEAVDLWRSEPMGYLLNESLFDALNDVAPENTYFGSSEGDGASYGFWYMDCDVCSQSLEDDHNHEPDDYYLAEHVDPVQRAVPGMAPFAQIMRDIEANAVDDRNSPDVEDGVR